MSKRLQVLLDDTEMREVRRAARRNKLTVAEWVRRKLRVARRAEPAREAEHKLAVIKAAMAGNFPAGEVGHMLAEIERGYLQGPPT